jgi:hypothetical protein
MDNMAEMIQQADADLRQAEARDEQAEAELRRAEAARAVTQAEVARMRGVLEWLRQHSKPQGRTAMPAAAASGRPAPTMNQSELCLWELEKLGGSGGTTDIRLALEREGYTYEQKQVRSALKYLARKGKIQGSGGIWHLPGGGTAAPFPADVMSTLALNGAGRES